MTINFLNWLKEAATYKEKAAELSSLSPLLASAYLKFDYELCIKIIEEHLYSSHAILRGFPIFVDLQKKNTILTEPNIDKNYARRFFEDALAEGIIQSYLSKESPNSSACYDLIRDIVTSTVDMDISNLEEAVFAICNLSMTMSQMPWLDITEDEKRLCFERLDKDWMWNTHADGSRDTTTFNLRQKACILALGIQAFKQRGLLYKEGSLPKVESANLASYGRLFYSRNTGPIVANQPMPNQKVSGIDILNPQIEVATYDRNPSYYPLRNSRSPYLSSLSGHIMWVVVLLDAYINNVSDRQSLDVTQKNISILFLLTAAISTRQGYHSIFETLNALTLQEIEGHFQQRGLQLDPLLYLHADVLNQAINDAGQYALVLANKNIVHLKLPSEKATLALIKHLERMNADNALSLTREQIKAVCVNIVSLFREIRAKVDQCDYLCNPVNGRLVWSPRYQNQIDLFITRFLGIMLPIGVIGPGALPAVLWIGDEGIIAAKNFGHPTQFTLPVSLIDSVLFNELKDAFFPQVFSLHKDTAVPCIYWAILSSLYASNIKGDVNLFMIENPIYSVSFFWNFELIRIRENRQNVWINTLKKAVLSEVKRLKENPDKNSEIVDQINTLLTTRENWIKRPVEEGLRVTSGSEPGVSISYAKLLDSVRRWRGYAIDKRNKRQSELDSHDEERTVHTAKHGYNL